MLRLLYCDFSATESVYPSDRLAGSRAALIVLHALHAQIICDGSIFRDFLTRLGLQMLASKRDRIWVMTVNIQPIMLPNWPNGLSPHNDQVKTRYFRTMCYAEAGSWIPTGLVVRGD